jgi:hypothetical protein
MGDVKVSADHGHVIIDMTTEGWWVSFDPVQARKLADILVAASFEAGLGGGRPEGAASAAHPAGGRPGEHRRAVEHEGG